MYTETVMRDKVEAGCSPTQWLIVPFFPIYPAWLLIGQIQIVSILVMEVLALPGSCDQLTEEPIGQIFREASRLLPFLLFHSMLLHLISMIKIRSMSGLILEFSEQEMAA